MSVVAAVRTYFSARGDAIFECRNCGTGLEGAEWTCPSCDSIEVAEYDRLECDAR
ncbi:hypothetical protein [Natronococcus jeotgali]|uniref:Small CPxCG-related zinc finger protein n=1 Tax=Natronococcus jeotgali DSM 18795 TaxID=1227498 RepID=L9XGH2_9EURY|nr:hypothetical protein [Natronococcus jeotgali]ELY60820.1 hypothetical protein C492_09980 [Natronococcus jeotgali DSM 18795]